MRRNRTHSLAQGHTLLELLIVLAIFGLFTAGVFEVLLYMQRVEGRQERQVNELQVVRFPFYQTLRELRMVGYPPGNNFDPLTRLQAPGLIATGFLEASANAVVFETDLDFDGSVERIEYRVAADGRSLRRQVFPKQIDGSLGAPLSTQETFIENLANQTLPAPLPVFSWDVEPDSAEPFPNNISVVYVSLAIEVRLDSRDPAKKEIIHLAGAARRINPRQ
ncbi:MAG: type II secretion system protein J [Terriglobia bacterium]